MLLLKGNVINRRTSGHHGSGTIILPQWRGVILHNLYTSTVSTNRSSNSSFQLRLRWSSVFLPRIRNECLSKTTLDPPGQYSTVFLAINA